MPKLIPLHDKKKIFSKRFPNTKARILGIHEDKLIVKCECGNHYNPSWPTLINSKTPCCNTCRYKHVSKNRQKLLEVIQEELLNKGLVYISGYKNNKSTISISCKKTGHKFTRKYSDIRDSQADHVICNICRRDQRICPEIVSNHIKHSLWLEKKVPRGLWKNHSFQLAYLQWLGKALKYRVPADWYGLTRELLIKNHGCSLLQMSKGSPFEVCKILYPNYKWLPWLFTSMPKSYFNKKENRLSYMSWLFNICEFKTFEDWYEIKSKHFFENKGYAILKIFNNSYPQLLKDSYPHYNFREWKFERVPPGFWKDKNNIKRFLIELQQDLNLNSKKDLLFVSLTVIAKQGGSGLVSEYKSWVKVLEFTYPEIKWERSELTHKTTKNYHLKYSWEEDISLFINYVSSKLNISQPEDWYEKASTKKLHTDFGGARIFSKHGTLANILNIAYPQFDFKEWLFIRVPKEFWKSKENCLSYLSWLAERLGLSQVEDWYYVTQEDFKRNRGNGILFEYGTVRNILKTSLDQFEWKENLFGGRSIRQKRLYKVVSSIFPHHRLIFNDKREHGLRFEYSKLPMEIDIFIPELKLGFEYQGIQHTMPIDIYGGIDAYRALKDRDKEKRRKAKKTGITLIEISDSWNGSSSEIIKSLKKKSVSLLEVPALDKVLGTFPPDPYQRIEEFREALQRLCINSSSQYRQEYFKDPRLVSNPQGYYKAIGSNFWNTIFGREAKVFYPTKEEALSAAKNLGIKTVNDYKEKYKIDPRLPSSPHILYKIEGGLGNFLGLNKEYYNLSDAMDMVRRMEINCHREYRSKAHEDPKLPTNPERFYKESPGWINANVFFGKKNTAFFYESYKEAKKAAKRLNIKTKTEYYLYYKQDPRLPSFPPKFYVKDWLGWSSFFK